MSNNPYPIWPLLTFFNEGFVNHEYTGENGHRNIGFGVNLSAQGDVFSGVRISPGIEIPYEEGFVAFCGLLGIPVPEYDPTHATITVQEGMYLFWLLFCKNLDLFSDGLLDMLFHDKVGQNGNAFLVPSILGGRLEKNYRDLDECVRKQDWQGALKLTSASNGQGVLNWYVNLFSPENRFRMTVIFDMLYNLGPDGLLTFDTFLPLFLSGKFFEAAQDLGATEYAYELPDRFQRDNFLLEMVPDDRYDMDVLFEDVYEWAESTLDMNLYGKFCQVFLGSGGP